LGLWLSPGQRRKWILFFLISGAVGWFQSALTIGAGTSIHHTVLFWINWYCAIALAAASVAEVRHRFARPVIFGVTALLAVRGIITQNLAYANLIKFSPITPWTTADVMLSRSLFEAGVTRAVIADWGIGDVLSLRTGDRIHPLEEDFELSSGVFDRLVFLDCTRPACAVVSHTPERVVFAAAAQNLDDSLARYGLGKDNIVAVKDTHGFPVFSVFNVVQRTSGQQNSQPTYGGVSSAGYARSYDFRFWATNAETGGDDLVRIIHWSVPGVAKIEIHVVSPSGTLFATGNSTGQATTGPWAKPGLKFFLQDASSGDVTSEKHTLAEIDLR
jgi:hypothetical protein